MGALPSQVTTGRVYWRVESDYLPAGAVSPITAPARGTVRLEPRRGAMNLPTIPTTDPLGMTLGLRTRTFTLVNGVLDRNIVADAFAEGWTYRATPSLEVMDESGKYVTASAELNAVFDFHLAPGATADLADLRPLGTTGTAGALVARGVGLTGRTRTVTGGVQWELTDGTWSDTTPMSTSGGATTLRGEVASQAALPTTATAGDQYVTTDTYHLWQWTGSSWVDLGPTQSGGTSGSTGGTTGGTTSPTLTTSDMTV